MTALYSTFAQAAADKFARLETASTAQERMIWAVQAARHSSPFHTHAPRAFLSTSCGLKAAVLLHMLDRLIAEEKIEKIPVVWIDTGYLHPETYAYQQQLAGLFKNVAFEIYNPLVTPARLKFLNGDKEPWEYAEGSEEMKRFKHYTKQEPTARAIRELDAQIMIAGLMREQGETRAARPVVERINKTLRLYPLIDWTEKDAYNYMVKHKLPQHPLWAGGQYKTVGNWFENPERRAECGMHEQNGFQHGGLGI